MEKFTLSKIVFMKYKVGDKEYIFDINYNRNELMDDKARKIVRAFTCIYNKL